MDMKLFKNAINEAFAKIKSTPVSDSSMSDVENYLRLRPEDFKTMAESLGKKQTIGYIIEMERKLRSNANPK